MTIVILQHPRERRSKCTVEPLRGHPEVTFQTIRAGDTYDATGHLLLTLDSPPMSPQDTGHPLLLLDSTWRLLPHLRNALRGEFIPRSLPAGLATAYPRQSKLTPDPAAGLASIEALYAATHLLGQPDESLLDSYYWKETFLKPIRRAEWPRKTVL